MSIELTDRQAQVIGFMNRFRSVNQCNPTCAEIADHFKWSSANAANEHIKALRNKGAVLLRHQKARGYIVTSAYMGLT